MHSFCVVIAGMLNQIVSWKRKTTGDVPERTPEESTTWTSPGEGSLKEQTSRRLASVGTATDAARVVRKLAGRCEGG
jgi:hypothetical protein